MVAKRGDKAAVWLGGVAFCILLAGCNGSQQPTAPVRGQITYDDKPVTSGTITFVPKKSGPAATGEIQKDGSYVLKTYKTGDGAVLGEHTVMIISLEDQTGKLPEHRSQTPPTLIPPKYSNNQTSGLSATVKEGDNTINFPLPKER